MRPAENIEKLINKLEVEPRPEVSKRNLEDALTAYKNISVNSKTNIWRNIMKSNMMKYTAAAMIILAVVLSITLFDKTMPKAYSVEQTIEAMKKIHTLHAFGIMDDGSEYECMVQLSQDIKNSPNIYLSLPSQTIVSTPQWSYIHNKQDNSFQTLKGDYLQARADFSNIIEWLYEEAVVPGLCDMTLEQIIGPDGNPQVQMILTGEIEATFFIDLKTKLLISAEIFSGETGDYVIRTIDNITYNEPLPEGIFDIKLPFALGTEPKL